jgi:V-type H+-transporting ATPase subunit H
MSTKLISSTDLQLLRRYDHKPEAQRGPLLEEVSSFIVLDLFIFALNSLENTTV